MAWTVLHDDDAAASWDVWASRIPAASPFQSYAVGQYYRLIGNKPYYCVFLDGQGEPRAMAICIVKARFWNVAILACVGGPIGDPALWAGLPDAMRRAMGLNLVYLRFRCDAAASPDTLAAIERTGWRRVPVASGSSLTAVLDMSRSLDELKAGLVRRWREELNYSKRQSLVLETNASLDPVELGRIFRELVATKQFASTIDETKIRAVLDLLGENVLFFTAKDAEGQVVAFRSSFVLGTQAVDFIAAASPEGRQTRASYAVFWQHVEVLKAMGVTELDLGGIDRDGNPGVYQFKMKTGAVEREMLGEFEIANWPALCWIVNSAAMAREMKFRLRNGFRIPAPGEILALPARLGAALKQGPLARKIGWLVPLASAAMLVLAVE